MTNFVLAEVISLISPRRLLEANEIFLMLNIIFTLLEKAQDDVNFSATMFVDYAYDDNENGTYKALIDTKLYAITKKRLSVQRVNQLSTWLKSLNVEYHSRMVQDGVVNTSVNVRSFHHGFDSECNSCQMTAFRVGKNHLTVDRDPGKYFDQKVYRFQDEFRLELDRANFPDRMCVAVVVDVAIRDDGSYGIDVKCQDGGSYGGRATTHGCLLSKGFTFFVATVLIFRFYISI